MTDRLTAAQYRALKAPKPNKYRAQKTSVDGITFASKSEAKRYATLRDQERAGLISDLTLQPRYPYCIRGKKVFDYIADFGYRDANGVDRVEDVKGMDTPVSRLKRKIIEADRGIRIECVNGDGRPLKARKRKK